MAELPDDVGQAARTAYDRLWNDGAQESACLVAALLAAYPLIAAAVRAEAVADERRRTLELVERVLALYAESCSDENFEPNRDDPTYALNRGSILGQAAGWHNAANMAKLIREGRNRRLWCERSDEHPPHFTKSQAFGREIRSVCEGIWPAAGSVSVATPTEPAESAWQPFRNRDDWLRDQHARYHDEPGNLLGRGDCEWQRCGFWDAATSVLDALSAASPVPTVQPPTCPDCGCPHDPEPCIRDVADCDCCRAMERAEAERGAVPIRQEASE